MKRTTKPAAKPQGAAKAAGPVSQALASAQAARRPGKGRGAQSLSPLAKAIRNAYKGAKPGRQEAAILRRIEDFLPEPGAEEVGQALAASGIPAPRAGKVIADWDCRVKERHDKALALALEGLERAHPEHDWRADSGAGALRYRILKYMDEAKEYDPETALSRVMEQQARDAERARIASLPAGKWEWEDLGRMLSRNEARGIASMFGTIYRTAEEGKGRAIILRILQGLAPSPERLESVLSEIPERERMALIQHHQDWIRGQERREAAAKRDEIATGLIRQALAEPDGDQVEASPQTAEDCPAYVKHAFDSADPDCIADNTGDALFRAWPIWAPGKSLLGGYALLRAADIPPEWHGEIIGAASDAQRNAEEIAREEETERRKQAQAPAAAEAPKPKAEARDPFGEALKVIMDSGYALIFNGKSLDLKGPPLWQREGVCIQPGEIKDIRTQSDVLIGLVDGLTNLLAERDPEDRETRKLSALREQVDNLIGLLDPVLAGKEGGL